MRLTVHIAGTAESPARTYPRRKSIVVWRNTPFHMKLGTCGSEPSAVPASGLMVLRALVPNVETLGYCQESLRDEDEILVALPGTGAAMSASRPAPKYSSPRFVEHCCARGRAHSGGGVKMRPSGSCLQFGQSDLEPLR